MSFSTAYFTPVPMGRDLDYTNNTRHSFHQRSCSGAYSEDLFLASKLPVESYNEDIKDSSLTSSGPYLHVDRVVPGSKAVRMKLQGLLNGVPDDQTENAYDSQSFQYSPVGVPVSFPLSPCPSAQASLSPVTSSDGSPVPAEMAPTLATMSSPISPMASFPGMTHSSLTYDDVMPYSYNMQYQTGYPFKHAGNASDDSHGSPPYNYSPDPSGSPAVLSSFPQRVVMNSLADQQYAVPNSPPSSLYHNGLPSPYGSHSPMSGPYNTYVSDGSNSLALTPPTTPHYGFPHSLDGHFVPGAPVYNEQFLSSRSNRYGTGSVPLAPASTFRARKTPYERTRSSDNSLGTTPAPRRFQCHECDKAFPTKGELASHSRCHLKVPAFLCGICGRPFKRRTDYVRHVRNVHEEVGRYGCALCGERFGRLDKLKRHDKRGCGNDKDDDDK